MVEMHFDVPQDLPSNGRSWYREMTVIGYVTNRFDVVNADAATGEPTPVQHIDTRGIHCRTFHIDPSGRMLVAAHIMASNVSDGTNVRTVPACLSTFRIGKEGKLDYVRKYDIDVGTNLMFWMGMVTL